MGQGKSAHSCAALQELFSSCFPRDGRTSSGSGKPPHSLRSEGQSCSTQNALETGGTDLPDMLSPSTAADQDKRSANALGQTQIFPFLGISKRDHGTSARFPLCQPQPVHSLLQLPRATAPVSFASSSAEHRWSHPALPSLPRPSPSPHHIQTRAAASPLLPNYSPPRPAGVQH